jgi:hypothetical protein
VDRGGASAAGAPGAAVLKLRGSGNPLPALCASAESGHSWQTAPGRDRKSLAAPVSCRPTRSGRDLKQAARRGSVRSSMLPSRLAALPPVRQRSTRTRGHDTCPSAAVSMRRRRRASGSQEPPRATNLWAASMTGPPATSFAGLEPSNLTSSRATCWVFRRSTSRKPLALMSRMEKVECTIRNGLPSTTWTTTLAWRTRCPAKSGTRAKSSCRSMRMKAVLASACSVSSADSRNSFDDSFTVSAVLVSPKSAGGFAGPRGYPASSRCDPLCGTWGRPTRPRCPAKTASTTPVLHLKHFGAGRVSDVLSEACATASTWN